MKPPPETKIATSSFFDYKGPGRISISRYPPRNIPAGYRVYKPLAPGPWFNSVSKPEYERRYFAQLALLKPDDVVYTLIGLAYPHNPVLLCWESKSRIQRGEVWCHRHMVALWLKRELNLIVEEI